MPPSVPANKPPGLDLDSAPPDDCLASDDEDNEEEEEEEEEEAAPERSRWEAPPSLGTLGREG